MKRLLVLFAALFVARLAAGQISDEGLPIQSLATAAPILISSSTTPETGTGYTMRTSVREVRVSFAVADFRGHPVTQVTAGDFQLFDSGRQVAQINAFETGGALPLRIVFMFDSSGSTSKMLPTLKAVAPAFLNSIFKPGLDTAMLVSFNTKVIRQQPFTGNAQLIANSLDNIRSGGLTSLYDSLLSVVKKDLASQSNQPERRLVILLSDGLDNYSLHSLVEAARELNRAGITLYSVFMGPKNADISGINTLQTLADLTGGKAFFPEKPKDFAPAFAAIEHDLRTQYSLTFHPAESPDGGFHAISIKPRAGQPWKIRARAGYVAEQDEPGQMTVAAR